ncbi:unnamed protein product [Vitrella brassicaformis CCMP3155]|uniref:Thioredoxin domain-containing protein n=1 Tax=Vitrella brassicaformis (strain CCMP3155) TaxID=1169540 RepID=A0A0G4GLE0_VITBC|nr:unnamed protein product [Vitrella brassicaformis CCMP3155]|eukprot:CEM30929.1 unnamed protein product [Vitrella brassicaformis CCMP3155]
MQLRCGRRWMALLVVLFWLAAVHPLAALDLVGSIQNVDASEFDALIKREPFVLVFFYAPWCYWSQVFFYGRYDIREYPTVSLFLDGERFENNYQGSRAPNSLVVWVNRHIDRDHVLQGASELEHFLHDPRHGSEDVTVVGLFHADEHRHLVRPFQHVSRHHDTVLFGHVDEAHEDVIDFIKKTYQLDVKLPSVIIFKPHDEKMAVFAGYLNDLNGLDLFVKRHKLPAISNFTQDTGAKVFPDGRPIIFLFKDYSDASWKAELTGVDNIEDELPVVMMVAMNPGGDEHYYPALKWKLQGTITKAALLRFIADVSNGRIKPFLKSEAVPDDNILVTSNVMTVVGRTFVSQVLDVPYDVFVKFEAPWCGHCRKMEPDFKRLARQLRHVRDIRFARIDATRNELEGIEIEGYPSLILFKRDAKRRPVEYSGTRNYDDMLMFLQRQATVRFDPDPPPGFPVDDDEPLLGDTSMDDSNVKDEM